MLMVCMGNTSEPDNTAPHLNTATTGVAELPALRSLTIQLPTVGGWDGDAAQKWDSFSGEGHPLSSFTSVCDVLYNPVSRQMQGENLQQCLLCLSCSIEGPARLELRRPQPAPGAAGPALRPSGPAGRLADAAVQ